MNKAFTNFQWENDPSVNTPLSAENLNKVNNAVNEIDNRVINFDTTKANQTDMLTAITNVSFNEASGIFTFTRKNGTTVELDTKLEKVVTNFDFDVNTQTLYLNLQDGTRLPVDLSAFITNVEFENTATIRWEKVAGGKMKAYVIAGSITADMLEPNYLANVQLYAGQAMSSASSAKTSAEEAEASAVRAEEAADKATEIAGGDFATNTKVDNIINGTTPVGNALKLNGLTAEEFVSNENLLINSDFRNPVNSSGATEWTSSGTTIDNWIMSNANMSVTLGTDGLVFNRTAGSYGLLIQTLKKYGLWEFEGKTLTLSVKSNGKIVSKTFTFPDTLVGVQYDGPEMPLEKGYFDFIKGASENFLTLRYVMGTAIGTSINIEWVKLELGKQATPFVPPNLEVEKLKCGAVVGNADTVDGYDVQTSGKKGIPVVFTDYGVMEVGRIIDFNTVEGQDFKARLSATDSGRIQLVIRNAEGTLVDLGTLSTSSDLANYLPLDGGKLTGALRFGTWSRGRINAGDGYVSIMADKTSDDTMTTYRLLQLNNSVHSSISDIERALRIEDVVNGAKKTYYVHHDGNSAKVVVSSTPLTAEGSIRVW